MKINCRVFFVVLKRRVVLSPVSYIFFTKYLYFKRHGYTVHQHFNFQLTHTTLKNVELLKHFKISKTAPTCFGLQVNHLQGDKVSTWLKVTRLVNSRYAQYTLTQCTIHTPYRSQYAAITLTRPCTSFTYLLLTKSVTFSQVLTLAP